MKKTKHVQQESEGRLCSTMTTREAHAGKGQGGSVRGEEEVRYPLPFQSGRCVLVPACRAPGVHCPRRSEGERPAKLITTCRAIGARRLDHSGTSPFIRRRPNAFTPAKRLVPGSPPSVLARRGATFNEVAERSGGVTTFSRPLPRSSREDQIEWRKASCVRWRRFWPTMSHIDVRTRDTPTCEAAAS